MKADKPLNILVMLHWAWGDGKDIVGHNGGAELMMKSLLTPLVERGHSIDVLEGWQRRSDRAPYGPYEVDGVRIRPYKNEHYSYVRNCDVVLTHLEQTNRAAAMGDILDKPVVMLCHNDYGNTAHFLEPRYAHYVHPVYNSEWMKASLEKPYRMPHPLGTIVRPAVVAEDYKVKPGNKVTLVNLNEDKGSRLFWDLAKRMPDIEFLAVVGAHGDQVIRRDLPNVEVVEHSPDMKAVYAKTRLLLMPSIYESWGRVGTEAMASGIPVLAHPTDGLVENLGDAGVFLDRDAPEQWSKAITRLSSPRAYSTASKKALARSAELEEQTNADLAGWVKFVESAKYHRR
jgi:glycosyltransferase involved in cell wall biosynthesis